MAGISSNPNSPRQKMINLMYLVFIAMMAINVSSEVLEGFELVEKSLRTSTENSTTRNEHIMHDMNAAYEANEAKVGEWHRKATDVKTQTDNLYDYINELKVRIVREADGKNGDVNKIDRKDDLEASSRIMLAPVVGEGKKLKEKIESYRTFVGEMIDDPYKEKMFESVLSTEVPDKGGIIPVSWESALFENMPLAAAITLLTKIQSDIRFVEGEVLSTLITNVDVKDYRVNKIQALVIPKSQVVTRGVPFEAQLVLAAIDSTKQPEYYLGATLLKNNLISITTNTVGDHPFTGQIIADGEAYPYTSSFSVTESSATIAPVLMNFLYESIDNDVEISLPGIPSGSVTASIEGTGNIKVKEKNIWTITGLSQKNNPTINIILHGKNIDGKTIQSSKLFNVRVLPDPLPFISYKDANGTVRNFKGGLLSKRFLVEATGVQAAIDDGVLNVPHKVTGFTITVVDAMGNSIPEVSNSGEFTQRQKELIRNMARGKQFNINNVKAIKPNGEVTTIPYSMLITVN